MASSSSRREVTPRTMQRGSGGQMSAPSPSSTRHSQPLPKGGPDVGCKTMRSVPSSRGLTRTALNKKNGSDRPEHPLSSHSRMAAEERASAAGGDGSFVPGAALARGGAGGGAAGGGLHRRGMTENSSSHSDLAADRRLTQPRDPLRRSRDTNVSDTPIMAERGGHGRDGPVIPRESTAATAGGGGGGGSRTGGGGGLERERTSGVRVGEEEIPMEVSGRYERMRVLGRGSFGAVTLVKDNRDSKLYAMKTLNCADKLEERVTAMAEVRLLKWLKHPIILSLFDTFLSTDGRLVCLTTTYCESGDLAKIVKHSSRTNSLLGEKTVLGWFAQLCLGVHHLHEEKKVLHRDIKPNNVFLMDSKKIVQLGDFGLAKVINDGDKQVKAEVGTPYYTSPEMCNNQPYGFPSDVWSLGIVLYELLSLDVPFRSRDVVALVSQVIKAPPPPLPEVYSSETTALARWMLQKDPLRRPTLTQALSCQPLRRHMASFVKHYRPMNMAERQRRHDIKDLEAQVASIIERGGDDPQIPLDVDDGCGTLPVGAQDEAAAGTAHDDPRSQPLEAPGSEAERLSFAGAPPTAGEGAAGPGGGGGGAAGVAGISRTRTIDVGFSSPRTVGVTLERAATALRTEGDEAGGGCVRCGARVPCACGGGGGGVGDVGAVGGGNITPGRRFGSPQQSKGARHVMSWTTGGSVTAGNGREGDGEPRSSASSSNGRGRRRRVSSSSGGSGGSVGNAEWDGRVSGRSSSAGSTKSRSSGDRQGSGGNERGRRVEGGSGARRKRCRAIEGRVSNDAGTVDGGFQGGSDHRSKSTDSNASPAPAARPISPRSPPSQRPARLKRASGGSGSSVGSAGNACIEGRDSESERALGVAARDTSLSKRESGIGHEEGALPARQQQAGGKSPPFSTSAAAASAAGAEVGAAATITPRASSTTSALHAAVADALHKDVEGARIEPGVGGELAAGPSTHRGFTPRTSATQEEARAHSVALAEEAPRASGGGAGRSPAAVPAAAGLAVGANTPKGGTALDRLGISPRTPRSPRLSGSGSDSFKTAKRLSEALIYAASGAANGIEEEIDSAPAPADTPNRVASVTVGGGLAPAVEKAAAVAATAPR